MKTHIVLFAAVFMLASTALAGPTTCPRRDSWPTKNWPTNVAAVAAAKGPEIDALEKFAFTLTGESGERKGLRTNGLVQIILNGLGDPNEMRKYVKNGTVKEFQLWDPQTPGVVAGAMLINEMIGKPFKQGSSVNIPCYGTVHSSAADGAVYAQNELTTFNAANIDKYQF